MKNKRKKDLHDPVHASHLEVVPRPDESFERTVKRFLKKVRNDGILQEVALRSYFEKPSQKRRRKSAKARFLLQKEQKDLEKF